jgi:hypothetical protein
VHLHRIHDRFYENFTEKPEFLKDTKFYIRKLKSEMFDNSMMVSFELLIPDESAIEQSFEGKKCAALNLIRVPNLIEATGANPDVIPILLIPDDISNKALEKLRQKYPPSTKLLSCFWFYFSIYFSLQLPTEPFVIHQSIRKTNRIERVREVLE